MIGVDTNILVRAVLDDDPKEAKIAKKFLKEMAERRQLFISSYAILEMVWVLKVKKCAREKIYEALLDLLDSPGIIVGQHDAVVAAAEKYKKGKADFGDYLILSEGEMNNATRLVTFDKQLYQENKNCTYPGKKS